MAGPRRVVVTGMGAIGPVGLSAPDVWAAVRDGRSGVAPITRFDTDGFETTFAAEVKGFDAEGALGRKEARRMDRYAQYAVAAAREAAAQAGLSLAGDEAERVAVLVGTGVGGLETLEQGAATLAERGPRRLGPFFIPMLLPNMASGQVAIALGAKGSNFAPTSACASSAHAIGEAAGMIRRGEADAAVAGGGEAPITKLGVAGFNAMGALSTRNDDPAGASRPFDADRDGFVLAEGGAMLVLEERERAIARGATPLGEVVGYGSTDDANHIVQPAPGGEGAVRAMRMALTSAGIGPEDIDYVNAHGTSTPLNEKLETQALRTVFGDGLDRLPVSSTKSMTGHLLGAAAAIEAVICLAAIADSCVPPTTNFATPDPECRLDCVPNTARSAQLRHVMSSSLGFGGHNAVLIFAAPS